AAAVAPVHRRSVGHCFTQQFGAGKLVAEDGLDRRTQRRHAQWMIIARRFQRISNGHHQNSHHGSSASTEKKMISARPTRFSTGTKPTPFMKRLSAELSRLSPIANTWSGGTTYSGVLFTSPSSVALM